MNLSKEHKKIIDKLNKNKQLKSFKDTFIVILVLNYLEICNELKVDPLNLNYFKIYMKLVVERLKIVIEDLKKERGVLNEEKEN